MLSTLKYRFVITVKVILLFLVFFSCLIFPYLHCFIVNICPKAQCRFVKPLQHFLRNSRPPDGVVSGRFEHAFFIAKHDHHRGSVGGPELAQSQFVTAIEGISSFPTFAAAPRTPLAVMQKKIRQDDGFLLGQIGASGGPLSIVSCNKS